MLYLSSYMKSQQSDAKHPLIVHIDNNNSNHHSENYLPSSTSSSNLLKQRENLSNNNNIYTSPVNKSNHHQKGNLYNNCPSSSSKLPEGKVKASELPPHLRYEQQLLSPIASSGNTLAGSVTGAIDSDYDLPPEERQILSLSHSPSPVYQPHLNQLTRLNYYQSAQQPSSSEYQNLVKPKIQPAPVTRGLKSDVSNNKIGGTSSTSTSSIQHSMNQATLANFTEPTSSRLTAPKMALHNPHYHQHTSSSNTGVSGTGPNQYECNNQLKRVKDNTYTFETSPSTRLPHHYQQQRPSQQQSNNFQSPVRGKLIVGETVPLNKSSSIYSVPKASKVSYDHSQLHPAPSSSSIKYTLVDTASRDATNKQSVPSSNTIHKMTDREQKELDQLLSDMYQELATFPNYNSTIRSTARSLSTSNYPSSGKANLTSNIYSNDGKPFSRSISHSPSVRNSKPRVLHYVPMSQRNVDDSSFARDTVDSGSVYATLANTSKDLSGKIATDTNSSVPLHSNCLPSSPSMFGDGESRGMSIRSVTLTPTPVRPLYATQHSLVTSTPKPIVVTDTSTAGTLPVTTLNNFKGTHVLPGARIGDQDAANRVGVYASTLGKKKLSSNERQELDDLINVMMEEVRNFPDYSSTKHYNTSNNTSTLNRLGYHNGSISNLEEVGIEATPTPGVARTRAVFENIHSHSSDVPVNRSPSPSNRSRQSNFFNNTSRNERERSYFSSGPTRTASISPVRHFNRGNSVVSTRSISTGRYPDRASIGTNATIITARAPSAASLLTGSLNPPYGTAGGVLAQPSTEPLPPHLLTRPTEWCKDERSRPYHARADSRPFTYGVTSASPLIQRRRVHSESTAYVVENRPRAHPEVDYNEPRPARNMTNGRPAATNSHGYSAGPTRGRVKSPGVSGMASNIYDDPSELEREMDAISEVSGHSGETLTGNNVGRNNAFDMGSSPASWLEKQQIKLKEKQDTNDTTYQEQRGKSKAMLSELTRTMSGSRVPGHNEMQDTTESTSPPPRPPSPPKSKLIERLNLVNGGSSNKHSNISTNNNNTDNNISYLPSSNNDYYDKSASPTLTSTNYARSSSPSKGKSVTLLTEDGEIVDTEGRPATPGRPHSQQSSSLHHALTTFASGPTPRNPSPTRYASYLHNNNSTDPSSSETDHSQNVTTDQPSPIYASVNLIDKHRMASSSHTDK